MVFARRQKDGQDGPCLSILAQSFLNWLPLQSFTQLYRELVHECQISRGLKVASGQDQIPCEAWKFSKVIYNGLWYFILLIKNFVH